MSRSLSAGVALVDWGPPCRTLARAALCCPNLVVTVAHDVPRQFLRAGVPARVYFLPDIVAILGPRFQKINTLLVPNGYRLMTERPGVIGEVFTASLEQDDDYVLIRVPYLPDGVQCLTPVGTAAEGVEMSVILLGSRDFVACRWVDQSERAIGCWGRQREAIILDDKGAWFGWSGSPVVDSQGNLIGIVARKGKRLHNRVCISPAWIWGI